MRHKKTGKEIRFSNDKPKMYDACEKKFGITWGQTTFAYDWTIHSWGKPSLDIIIHETVHFLQQDREGGADKWWDRYLDDEEFRYRQELEAYAVQAMFTNKRNIFEYAKLLQKMYGISKGANTVYNELLIVYKSINKKDYELEQD